MHITQNKILTIIRKSYTGSQLAIEGGWEKGRIELYLETNEITHQCQNVGP